MRTRAIVVLLLPPHAQRGEGARFLRGLLLLPPTVPPPAMLALLPTLPPTVLLLLW